MNGNSAPSLTALYPVICVDEPERSAAALGKLLGLQAVFTADWYVHLRGGEGLQVAFVRKDHESVPAHAQTVANGLFVTVDCDDVASFWRDNEPELDVVTPLTDEPWGQRHFICRIPGDILVDVVQLLDDIG